MRIKNPAPFYDVVVVGGGMVGASFAYALSKAATDERLSICVVESFAPDLTSSAQSTPPSFDARSTALSYGSRQIYAGMGLWSELSAAVTPIKEIQISDKGRLGSARITCTEQRVEALGYVIENKDLGLCLVSALDTLDAVDFYCPAAIKKVAPAASGMTLEIESGSDAHTVSASLVVMADGGKSPISEQLGITQKAKAYKQQALIANIAFNKPHNNIAFERFTDTGPLAVLPLAAHEHRNRGALVWTLGDDQVAEFESLSDADLLARLQERFGNRLGTIQHIGTRSSFPLNLTTATEQIRPGLVLLGNVAHTLHPVAGQGLNLALRDAQALVATLLKARANNESVGSMRVLQKYLNLQQSDQDRVISFTDFTTRLFSSNNSVRVWARKAGLLAIDLLPALRQEFAKQAMGSLPKR